MSVLVYRDKATACSAAATLLAAAVIEKPTAVLGLDWAPELKAVYRGLARMTGDGLLEWGGIKAFNLYEHVRADADESMAAQLDALLLDRVNIPPENRFAPDAGGSDWNVICSSFENDILAVGGLDTVLCAIRPDGSVAFNQAAAELAPVTHVERTESGRVVTAGMATIMSAKRVIALMTGADKAAIACSVFNGPIVPDVPASYLQLHANVVFFLDEDAAEKI